MFLRWRNWDMSISYVLRVCSAMMFCFTNFLSYRIRISFSFSYFSF